MSFRTLAAGLLVAFVALPSAHAQTLKVALVTPQTGPLAGAGKDVTVATQAWASERNAAGGIRGRKIDVRVYDDESNGDGAKRATAKAIADGVEVFLNCFGTVSCIQIAKDAQAANLALIGPIAGAEVLRTPGFANVFSTRPSASAELASIFRYASTVGHTESTVIYQDDGFGNGYREALPKALEAVSGMRIKNQFAIDTKAKNFDDVAAKVIASGDVLNVVLLCNTPNSIAMISALNKRAYRGVHFNLAAQANDGFINAVLPDVRASKSMVAFVTTAPAPAGRTAAAGAYRAALVKYGNGAKPGYVGLEAFVSASVLEKLTDGFSPDRIDATLRKHPRDGVIGGIAMTYLADSRTLRGWLDIAVVSPSGQIRHE